MTDCIFCKIIKGEIPSYKIYEDETTYAFLDISKDVYGHTLVVPKTHHNNLLEAPSEIITTVMDTVYKVATHYKSLGFSGINILNNNGVSSGQSVNHLHFHVIPRTDNDNVKIYNDLTPQNFDLKEISDKLFIKSCQ